VFELRGHGGPRGKDRHGQQLTDEAVLITGSPRGSAGPTARRFAEAGVRGSRWSAATPNGVREPVRGAQGVGIDAPSREQSIRSSHHRPNRPSAVGRHCVPGRVKPRAHRSQPGSRSRVWSQLADIDLRRHGGAVKTHERPRSRLTDITHFGRHGFAPRMIPPGRRETTALRPRRQTLAVGGEGIELRRRRQMTFCPWPWQSPR
jgi:hypothetical protein